MPFDGLIDAAVTALVVTLLSARRPGRTSRAPRGPAAERRGAPCPRCAAPACPAATSAPPGTPGPPASPTSPAAFADDFGATVMWRYPPGVRPVSAFDPTAFEARTAARKDAEGNSSSTASRAGRGRSSTPARPAGHR